MERRSIGKRTGFKLESCTATYLHRASSWLSPFSATHCWTGGAMERDVMKQVYGAAGRDGAS
jgi:hypothetical protein